MKSIYLTVLFAALLRPACAIMSQRATPAAYAVTFVRGFLPADAKIVCVAIDVHDADEILVGSLPAGWVSRTISRQRLRFQVSLAWSPWKEEKGTASTLEALSSKIWIRPLIDERKSRIMPKVSGVVQYLREKNGKLAGVVEELSIPKDNILLSYIE